MAGITLIDPRDPPLQLLDAIRRCTVLLSEALHGVIVADAFRVPWIAVRPLAAEHRPKWTDWSDTVRLKIRWQRLSASSAREWISASRIGSLHHARPLLERHGTRFDGIAADRFVTRAAAALQQAASAAPQLSDAAALDRCQSRMMTAVTALRRQPFGDSGLPEDQPQARRHLHREAGFVYQRTAQARLATPLPRDISTNDAVSSA